MAISDIIASKGSVLYIATALPASNDKSTMEALTWKEIGLIDNQGGAGKTFSSADFVPVKEGTTVPKATSSDNGSKQISYAYTAGVDTGHDELRTREGLKSAFREDMPNGKTRYFHALVLGGAIDINTVGDIVTEAQNLRLTEEDILEVDSPST